MAHRMSETTPAALPLVVGVTTLPSRIHGMRPMLDSLLAQTHRPDKVLLGLPRLSRREGLPYDKPDWLSAYAPWLQVVPCAQDWGPGTKLLACLDHLPEPCMLVIADDDMRYRPFFLEQLYRYQDYDRHSSFSYCTYRYGPIEVAQGADGFSFYSPNLSGLADFAEQALRSPQVRQVDDLWISAFLQHRRVRVQSLSHLVPEQGNVYESSHLINQLHQVSGDLGRGQAMREGTRFLLEQGLLGRRAQAEALLRKTARRALAFLEKF